jgi:hypothetical protein
MANRRQESPFESALDRLRDLILQVKRDFDQSQSEAVAPLKNLLSARIRFIMRADLGTVILTGDHADLYSGLLLDLQEAVQSKHREISIVEVESVVQETLLTALDVQNKSEIKDFSERLEIALSALRPKLQRSPCSWQAHLEVAGLAPEGLPSTFGNFDFYLADSSNTAHISNWYESMVDSTKHSLIEKEQYREFFSNLMLGQMVGRTYARIKVLAVDKNAAEAVARRQLRQSLDIINFFGAIAGQSSTRLCLPGEAHPCISLSVVLPDDLVGAAHIPQARFGPLAPFSFASMTPKISKRTGFEIASAMLAKPNRSDLDDRVLTALQWAGRASVEERIEESFLLFAVSLESLLLTNKEIEQITYRFSVRGAHLIGRDFEAKQRICSELKILYRLRSAIVHSGKTEASEANRDAIGQFARTAILNVLLRDVFRGMSSSQELDTWFEDQVIGPKLHE